MRMWLILQIAAGIVLAYVIIKNGAAVWRFSVGALILTGISVGVIALGSMASDAAGNSGVFAKVAEIVGMLVFAIILIISLLVAGSSIRRIGQRISQLKFLSKIEAIWLGMANLNLVILILAIFQFGIGIDLLQPLNRVSRAQGWDDTLPVLAWIILSLWPVPISYWLMRRAGTENDEPKSLR